MKLREKLVATVVVLVVLLLGAGVVALVLGAESAGLRTRQRLRAEQTRQLANSMESRVQTSFAAVAASVGAPGLWELEPGAPADAARLQPRNPEARTGSVLVNVDGVIVNGSLLRDPDAIGRRLTRPGLARVLTGEPAILPVAEGLTTPLPTIAVAVPIREDSGALAGAHLTEVEVAPESPFNLEVAELRVEDGSFSFVDELDVVLASSDLARLGERIDEDDVAGLEPGFHRRGGRVAAVAEVPSAGWRLVFDQDEDAFQGDLTTPLRLALLLLVVASVLFAAVAAVLLVRRLAAAREEQQRISEIAAAREDFTSIVSHELRTPVAGLLGFLQTTIDHWEVMPDAERRRAVQRAFVNARSLQALTSDVLDSASIEADTLTYRFTTLDVRSVVADAVAATRDTPPSRQIRLEQPEVPQWVRADALRLAQVLATLLDNASRSSPVHTPIDVMVEPVGDDVHIRVCDHGPGIAPDERELVFQKFTRGRASIGRGTGLGLYISRHIVEAHGGRIWVEDDEAPGATITFTLPSSGPPADPVI